MKTIINALAIIAIVLVPSIRAQDKAAKTVKTEAQGTGAAAYDDFAEPWRSEFVKVWQKVVSEAKNHLKSNAANIRGSNAVARKEAVDRAKMLRSRLEQLEKNNPPFIRSMRTFMCDWSVGDYGMYEGRGETVFQVIDKDNMLVFAKGESPPAVGRTDAVAAGSAEAADRVAAYRDAIRPRGKDAWVMFSGFPTAGIADGDRVEISQLIRITGTTTYTTTSGGSKTVLVAEPLDLDSLKKNAVGAVAQNKPVKPAPAAPKTGAAAYDSYPEPLRGQLVKEWEGELEALKRAIKDDEDRLSRATTAKDREHFSRLITEYKGKLARHEKNDPPYISKDRQQLLKEMK